LCNLERCENTIDLEEFIDQEQKKGKAMSEYVILIENKKRDGLSYMITSENIAKEINKIHDDIMSIATRKDIIWFNEYITEGEKPLAIIALKENNPEVFINKKATKYLIDAASYLSYLESKHKEIKKRCDNDKSSK